MKKFFQEIKADLKFKTAGPGQKLTESPREKSTKEKPKPDAAKCRQGPTNEAQMAAAAALARLEQKPKPRPPSSQDAIRNQVKKELMAEAAASDKGLPVDQKHAAKDPVAASIMQIHTLNRDREKVKLGVETIAKIHCLEGTDQFFQAVGFEKVALDVAGQGRSLGEAGRPERAQGEAAERGAGEGQAGSPAPNFQAFRTSISLRAAERLLQPHCRGAETGTEDTDRRGTFYAREPVSALFHFVRETLQNDWLPFELLAPGGHRLTDENLALNESGLVR
ncbi:hypothetical protein E2320_022073, partial [Naja naja]